MRSSGSPSAAPAGARRSTLRRFSTIRTRRSPGSAARDLDRRTRGADEGRPRAPATLASPRTTTKCSRHRTWTSSRSRRPTTCTPTRPSPPPRRASTSCSKSRPASTSPSSSAFATRCERAGVRTIVSFELRYNPFLKFARWLRTERLARRDPLRAHAVSVARDRLVQRLGLGAHARERTQPPARSRLPRRRRAALVLRTRADRRERVPHAVHRADTSGRPRSSRT